MGFENISINKALEYAGKEKCYIVDVRDIESYLEGHLPYAINIPYEEIEEGNFYLSNARKIIVYCDRGAQSLLAVRYLVKRGYKVVNCIGGFNQYTGKIEKDRGGM